MNSLYVLAMMVIANEKGGAGPPAPDEKPALRQLADDVQTLRLRIDNNMKSVGELLRRHDWARARELQNDILRDIDKLLARFESPEENPNSPPPPPPAGPPPSNEPIPNERQESSSRQSPSGGSRTTQAPQSDQPQPGGGSSGREKSPNERQPGALPQPGGLRRERRGQRQQPQNSDRPQDQAKARPSSSNSQNETNSERPGARPGDVDGAPGANPDQARGAMMSPGNPGQPDKLSDVARDVWGHLPDSLRQEVDHYYRERFMPRYRELLQQYYNRLAETERRSKDRK